MKRMMRLACLVTTLIFALTTGTAIADTLNVLGGAGAWYGGWTANNSGEFWDNSSDDSAPCNVGYWISGTAGPCSSVVPVSAISPTGTWDFLASSGGSGTNVAGFTFSPAINDHAITLQVEVAGFANTNSFGWYYADDPNTLFQLFAGATSPQSGPLTFTPTKEYGFYLQRADGPIFKTGDTVSSESADKHFALFSDVHSGNSLTKFFLAVEDKIGPEGSDFDFNDMIVRVVVPEPGFFGLLAVGSAGLVLAYRRRRSQQE